MAKTPAAAPTKAEDWDSDEAAAAALVQAGMVRVKCIVHTFPHTGIPHEGLAGLGMAHKEVREVPEGVALAMEAVGQVEIL